MYILHCWNMWNTCVFLWRACVIHVTKYTTGRVAKAETNFWSISMTACHQTRFPVLLTAKYLTTTICVSAMSMIIQVAILNIYYKEPLVPVPGWLRHVTRCHLCTRGNRRVESEPISNQEKEGDVDESCARESTEFGKQRQAEDNNITPEPRQITSGMDRRVSGEVMQEEWKRVGQILDRSFFFIFIAIELCLIFTNFGIMLLD